MAKQCLVIGLGRFGSAVATTLYELGYEVVAIDHREEPVEAVTNLVTYASILDATDERALRAINVDEFDVVVVAIGSDIEGSILATLNAKSLGAAYVVSKATNETSRRVLEKIGADLVIRPEHDMGVRLARQLARPNLMDTLDLGSDHTIAELEVNARISGTLKDRNLTNRFGVQVIAVKRGSRVEVSPRADFELKGRDHIVVVGTRHGIEDLRRYLGIEG